jgi:hypothetical protein
VSSTDVIILRSCLGNLYAAVQRFGPIDADIQFAMREAAQALGPPYSAVETPVVPDGDRCDRCGIWLPPVAEWSMPSCPDCVEAFEADELKPPLDKPHRHF